jgi:hypothetical protein
MQACFTYKIGNLAPKQFERYLHSGFGYRNRLENEAMELMRAIGAQPGSLNDDFKKYIPRVIDLWNSAHKNTHAFKAFVFDTSG